MILVLIAVGVVALLALWFVPKFQVRSANLKQSDSSITAADLLKAENDRRTTLAQILGGLAILGTVYGSNQTLLYNSQTLRLQQNGQLTDRISKAVDQLGSTSATIRLGGIHQLGRIAADSAEERSAMLHILASHLEEQEQLKRPLQTRDCDPFRQTPMEVAPHDSQAVVDVLRTQHAKLGDKEGFIQMDRTNLRVVDFSGSTFGMLEIAGSDLTDASLQDAHFASGSQFQFSDFSFADLSGAALPNANLQQVCFVRTDLSHAALSGAALDGADFRNSGDLTGTNFTGATLRQTNFRGVDLRGTIGLEASKMRDIKCNAETKFPGASSAAAKEFAALAQELNCSQVQDF